MNVVTYILSFCEKVAKATELDEDILREVYERTKEDSDSDSEAETSDSEDSDYEPPETVGDIDMSSGEEEEIIVKRDSDGRYYIY